MFELITDYDKAMSGSSIYIPVITVRINAITSPPIGVGGGAITSLVGKNLTRASDKWIHFSPETDWMCLYVCFAASMNLLKKSKKRKTPESEVTDVAAATPEDVFEPTRTNKRKWTLWAQTVRNQARAVFKARGETDLFPTHEGDFRVLQCLCDVYDKSCVVYGTHFGELARFEPQDPSARLQRVQPLPEIDYTPEVTGMRRTPIRRMEVIELHYTKNHYSLLLPRVALTHYFGDSSWTENLPQTLIENRLNFYQAPKYAAARASPVPGATVPDTPEGIDCSANRIVKPRYRLGPKVFGDDCAQRMRLLAFDTETYCEPITGKHILYATGVAWWESTFNEGQDGEDEMRTRTKLFYGEDSFDAFLTWLSSGQDLSPDRVHGSYLFAHNGGRYDITSLVNGVALGTNKWEFVSHKMMESSDRWISGMISCYMDLKGHRRPKKRVQVKLRDSWPILPQALAKLGKDFRVEVLKGDIPHDRVVGGAMIEKPTQAAFDEGTCAVHWEHMRRDDWDGKGSMGSEKYLAADCLCLLHIMSKYNRGIFERWGFEVFSACTAASIAKRLYLQKYHKDDHYALHSCSDELDAIIRQGYIGGRCEAFVLGVRKAPTYYYDVTSLYPACATGDLPGGMPEVVGASFTEMGIQSGEFFGFVIADVWADLAVVANHVHYFPLHGWYQNSRLIFGWPETPIRMVLTSESIKDAEKYMPGVYKYSYKWGIRFMRSRCMKSYFEDLFELKAEARKNGQDAIAAAAKITANSGYGWAGLRWCGKDSMMMNAEGNRDVFNKMLEERRLVNYSEIGKYQLMRVRKDVPHDSVSVQCAAWISDSARRRLFELMFAIRNEGHRVFYCDTDSVMTSLKLSDYPQLLNKFCPDHASGSPGALLGSLKNELAWDEPFDMGVWNGCKYYALSRTMPDGSVTTTTKLKGYQKKGQPELTPEILAKATENIEKIRELFGSNRPRDQSFIREAEQLGCIISHSKYFSFSKSSMLDTLEKRDNEIITTGWHICTRKVTKLFRPIYNKGEILALESDGLRPIIPFIYNADGDDIDSRAPDEAEIKERMGELTLLAHHVNGADLLGETLE
tara:strand:+ start:7711 stop:10947 length:3237 start_codon:yes stop_codon:yes gene_type:complete